MHVTHDVGIGCICTVRCDYVALLASVIHLCKMFGLFWITLCWIVSDGLSVCAIRQHVDTSATSPYSSAFCNIYLYLCICTCIHIYAFVFVYLYLCIVSSAIRQAVYTSALGTLSVLICILLKYKYKSKYKLKRVSVNTNTHQPSEVSTSCRLSSALSISYIPWTCYCYILAGRGSLFSLPYSLLPDCSSTTPPYTSPMSVFYWRDETEPGVSRKLTRDKPENCFITQKWDGQFGWWRGSSNQFNLPNWTFWVRKVLLERLCNVGFEKMSIVCVRVCVCSKPY